MNGPCPNDAVPCEMVGEIAIVRLPKRLVYEEECQAVSVQLGRLLGQQHCDFILDFADTGHASTLLIGHPIRLANRAKDVAEQLGKRVAAPARPLGHGFKMFDDRAGAVAEMRKFDGHGWLVFCSVSPVVQEVFVVV